MKALIQWSQCVRRWLETRTSDAPQLRAVLSVLLLIAVLGFVGYICAFKVFDRDFWWHITAGEIMLKQQSLIHSEFFAYTRAGQPYLATYEWLAQIVLFLVYHAYGSTGVILFRTGMVALVLLILLAIDLRHLWPNALLAIWTANVAWPGFVERPQLFTFVLLAAFLWLAFRFLERKDEDTSPAVRERHRLLASFLGLQVLWINVHGAAAVMGMTVGGALFLQTAYDWHRRGQWSVASARAALGGASAVLGGLLAASFVSPNTYHHFTYLWQLLSDQTTIFIHEWQPRPLAIYLVQNGLLWVLALTSLLLFRRHWVFSALLLGVTGLLSLQALRHEMLFMFTATAVTFYQLKHSTVAPRLWRRLASHRLWATLGTAALLLILARYTQARYADFVRRDHLNGYGTFDLARGAYDFLEREQIHGTMFNTYGIGGYLIHRGYQVRPVYVDGRNVDYGYDFLTRTYAAGFDAHVWQQLEDQYHFTYALIDYDAINDRGRHPYSVHLNTNPHWKLVYLDDWMGIYVKDITENQPVIDRDRYDLLTPENLDDGSVVETVAEHDHATLERELKRVVAENSEGIKGRLALARLYLTLQRYDEAEALASDVVHVQPYRADGYALEATIAVNHQDWPLAGQLYEKAIALAGDAYPDINYQFVAQVFAQAGNYAKANFYSRLALSRGQGTPVPASSPASAATREPLTSRAPEQTPHPVADSQEFNNHGVELAQQGKLSEAKEEFLNALKLNPRYPEALNNIGSLYFQQDNWAEALSYYEQALKHSPDFADAHFNLATVLIKLGRFTEARQHRDQAKRLGRDVLILQKLLDGH